jgi:hypothetical protein
VTKRIKDLGFLKQWRMNSATVRFSFSVPPPTLSWCLANHDSGPALSRRNDYWRQSNYAGLLLRTGWDEQQKIIFDSLSSSFSFLQTMAERELNYTQPLSQAQTDCPVIPNSVLASCGLIHREIACPWLSRDLRPHRTESYKTGSGMTIDY